MAEIELTGQLESILTFLLQKDVNFIINKKVIKSGKILLFKIKNFHIEFLVLKNDKNKKVDIPIPFKSEFYPNEKLVYFDYRNKTFANSSLSCYNIDEIIKHSRSKYKNCILEIVPG
jgi:hypothetical protein